MMSSSEDSVLSASMWHLHLHGICLQCEHGHGMLPWPVGSAAALDDEALGAAVVSAFCVGRSNKHRTLDSATVLDDDVPRAAASPWMLDSAGVLDDDASGVAVGLGIFLGFSWSMASCVGLFFGCGAGVGFFFGCGAAFM